MYLGQLSSQHPTTHHRDSLPQPQPQPQKQKAKSKNLTPNPQGSSVSGKPQRVFLLRYEIMSRAISTGIEPTMSNGQGMYEAYTLSSVLSSSSIILHLLKMVWLLLNI